MKEESSKGVLPFGSSALPVFVLLLCFNPLLLALFVTLRPSPEGFSATGITSPSRKTINGERNNPLDLKT